MPDDTTDVPVQDRVAVLIPAAGLSTRFGRNKLHEFIDGKSVMLRTVEAFLGRPDTAAVLLATPLGRVPPDTLPADLRTLMTEPAVATKVRLVEGGPTRAHSVQAALAHVPAGVEWVAVHDAARPLVTNGLIDRLYAHARVHGSAVPAMPVRLTIKQATGPLPAAVVRTLPRAELWEMQTPQVMRRSELAEAYQHCPVPLETLTDDAQLLEIDERAVWLVPGEERNLKITTPGDLVVAATWLAGV